MESKDFQLKLEGINDKGEFKGHAAYYGNLDRTGDIIDKGAFSRTLSNSKNEVIILLQHNTHDPIGQGRLYDKEKSLDIHGFLNMNLESARKAHTMMKPCEGFNSPMLRGLSIGYDVKKEDYRREDGRLIRILKEIQLHEVSLVTFPANPKAVVTDVKQSTPKTIQSIIFSKDVYESNEECKEWLKEHDYRYDKVDETENSYRYRQRSPGDFDPESMKTIRLSRGIQAVVGNLKKSMDVETRLLKLEEQFAGYLGGDDAGDSAFDHSLDDQAFSLEDSGSTHSLKDALSNFRKERLQLEIRNLWNLRS